ncbi:MAG: helix-turn-helix domain-containing protein [Rubrivivax sp.]
MSNAVTIACRELQLPATQKAVLMCIADYCHDDGRDWHSIASMVEWTCLSKRTVIDALKALEDRGLIVIKRDRGVNNTTFVQVDRIEEAKANQCASRTSAPAAPVQELHGTSATDALPLVQEPHQLVQQPHAKHQEASVKHQEAKKTHVRAAPSTTPSSATPTNRYVKASNVERPDDVDAQTWADWLQLRKAKRAPVTATVMAEVRREAAKAGMTLEDFLRAWCVRGSQGLQADWLRKPITTGNGYHASLSEARMARTIAAAKRFAEGDQTDDQH